MDIIDILIKQTGKKMTGTTHFRDKTDSGLKFNRNTMRRFPVIYQVVSAVLSALVITLFPGCGTTTHIPGPEIAYAEKTYCNINGDKHKYTVTATNISEGILTGITTAADTRITKGNVIDLFIAPDSAIQVNGSIVSVPVANIAKAEIYRITAGRSITVAAGVAAGAFWTVILIVLLTKGISCPFVYSESGTDITLEGEIYSGATALPVERDDYLRLKTLSPVDERYRIRITNEVKEIQNTNLAELLVYDHPEDVEILVDKYGNTHTLKDIREPVSATNAYGKSLASELAGCDDKRYISEIRNDDLLFDTISLSFDRPLNSNTAKLVISAKNTMWLDYMFGRLSDMFGSRYDEWVRIRNKRSREYLLQWSLDQGIPLAVYLETQAGLEFIDYYNVPGPVKDKRDIIEIDLEAVTTERVNIKLVSGVMFWDFDFAGMDFSEDIKADPVRVSPDNAVDETGREITSLLLHDDDMYLVQPSLNNEARLCFTVPPQVPGTERSVFLHSKGNYQPLRDARGKPDMELLVSMRLPGKFTRFTKDHFLSYYADRN
jgi:hypothetical protein